MLPRVHTSAIPGLLVLELDLRGDARGFFKENWQRAKMVSAGLPDFEPVQQNVSFNERRGVLRGLHAEPWDKLVSVATGRIFGAWVDLREGPSYGVVVTREIGPSDAVFVPRGVANGFQVLEDGTAYTYLVNDHWRPDQRYVEVDALDPALGIPWPVDPADAAVEMSEKDRANPALEVVTPFPPAPTLVIGTGQLGSAFAAALPAAVQVGRADLDLADTRSLAAFDFSPYAVVVNTASFTRVDEAETPAGRREAWSVNAEGTAALARSARETGFTLVHYSTDYVFDGTRDVHTEDEPTSPLGAYGQSKAAGELALGTVPRHYLIRTSWLVGDGPNFVRTMRRLAVEGVCPEVVDDQVGRLTFTDELVRATRHLVDTRASAGTYHVTNGGTARSWADYARRVFAVCGRNPGDVISTSTEHYAATQGAAGKQLAPRPRHSVLSLAKLEATGFRPADADAALSTYLDAYLSAYPDASADA